MSAAANAPALTPARWQAVKAILAEALEEPDAAARAALAAGACAGDAELRREVESLLAQQADGLERFAAGAESRRGNPDGAGEAGRRVGAYELVRELGHGGMGAVFLARRADGRFEQQVAVKLLKRGTDTEEVLRRFRAERQILARLVHPNIARLLDGGETAEGLPFFVLEYVDGTPLTEFARGRDLSVDARLALFRQVCAAVQFAHQNLVVHRDLKPGNILVTAEGEPKLLDFGIAKLLEADAADAGHTLPGLARLTPAYASPEQARGEPVTTASDVYALGALLYELLTGRSPHPFSAPCPGAAEIARVVGTEPILRPSLAAADPAIGRELTGDLDNILLKALEKDPARRYPTVNALAEDLRRRAEGQPVRARAATWHYLACKFVARNRLAVAAAAALLLAVAGGAAGTLWQARLAERRFRDVSALAHSFLFEFQDSIRDLPGSTPARRLLVTRALEYLGKLERETGGDTHLRRELAAAYVQVGHVQGQPNYPNVGDTPGALKSYRRAVAIADTLPDDEASAAVRAETWEALGNLLASGGKSRAEAVALLRRALKVRQERVTRAAADPAARRALAGGYLFLADAVIPRDLVLCDREEAKAGEVLYQRALALRERLHAEHPADTGDARALAKVHYRLGSVNYALGLTAGDGAALIARSMDHHRRSAALREECLAAQPASGMARRELADGLVMKAIVQTRYGDAAGALADCRRGIELFAGLAAADPDNSNARGDLAFAYECAAYPLRALGDFAGALEDVDRSLVLYDALAAEDPASLLGVSRVNFDARLRTEICAERGDQAGVKESARRWIQCAARLAAAAPEDAAQRADLERARAAAGDAP